MNKLNNNQNIILQQNEIFKQIIGYEEKYLISNHGRVYSSKTNRILKQSEDSNGYYNVSLCIDNKKSTHKIHKLVANHFLVKTDQNFVVDHINRNKLDNHVVNLRFVSYSDNNKNRSVKGCIRDRERQVKNGITKYYEVHYTPLNQNKISKSFKDRASAEAYLYQLQILYAR